MARKRRNLAAVDMLDGWGMSVLDRYVEVRRDLHKAIDALSAIHKRNWPAGDKRTAARNAVEMWDIADKAMQELV
jgi:hypothetical protein